MFHLTWHSLRQEPIILNPLKNPSIRNLNTARVQVGQQQAPAIVATMDPASTDTSNVPKWTGFSILKGFLYSLLIRRVDQVKGGRCSVSSTSISSLLRGLDFFALDIKK